MTDAPRDWVAWHSPYDLAGSPLAVRLALVQSYIRLALDRAPEGEIRVVSLCAGQGRDLLGVAEHHPRREDLRALLVELDEHNAEQARSRAAAIGLEHQVAVVVGDAAVTDHYLGHVPAHLILCCGVFGNISDEDIERTVSFLTDFCATGAVVVWTRHRRPPDLTGEVRTWFREVGFREVGFEAPRHLGFVGVGAARWLGPDGTLAAGERLFTWREAPAPPT